jgi:Sulfotransferase domain
VNGFESIGAVGLEFIVIGAQKAGTTTLWQLLRDHPQLWLAETKEAPFFSHTDVYERGWQAYLARLDPPAGDGLLHGTVTPHYMHGWHDADTSTVALRIARCLPHVRLIALLRDPVERARSQHAMAVARGREQREVDRALSELLHPDALRAARARPDDTNSYVVQGEYGRILEDYLSCFPRSALHIEYSASLAQEPVETVRRTLRFLGVSADYRPAAPFQRAFAGGREQRVGEEALTKLLRGIDLAAPSARRVAAEQWVAKRKLDAPGREELLRLVGRYLQAPSERRSRERAGLEFTLRKTWNIAPAPPTPISAEVRRALQLHFAADAERLHAATGCLAPWARGGRALTR